MVIVAFLMTAAWTEGFETQSYFPPNDWIVVNEDALDAFWYRTDSVGHSSTHCATCYGDTLYSNLDFTNLDWLITPQVLPQGSDTIMSFWHRSSAAAGCSLDIMISTASLPAPSSFAAHQTVYLTQTSWTTETVSLDTYLGVPIYIAFRVRRIPTQQYFYLDDINLPGTTSQPYVCNGRLRTKGAPSQKYLQLWGSHYDMGYVHGFLLAEEVVAGFKRTMIGYSSLHLITPYEWDNVLIPYFNSQFSIPTRYLDESEGLFDGLVAKGVDLFHPALGRSLTPQDIRTATAVADFIIFMCSSISGWGESTANDDTLYGGTIFVRDLDFYVGLDMSLANTSVVFAHNPSDPDEQRFVNIGHAGWFGCHSGINEEGLGLCIDVGNHADTNYIPPSSLKPIMLSCRDALAFTDPDNSGINDIYDITYTIDHPTSLFSWDMHLVSPYDITHPVPTGILEINNIGDTLRLVASNNIMPSINSQFNLAVTNHHRILYPPTFCGRYSILACSLNANFHLNTQRAITLENVVAAPYTASYSHCTAQQIVFRPNVIVEHPDWPSIALSTAGRMSPASNFPKTWYSWDELFEGMPGVEEYVATKPGGGTMHIVPNPFTQITDIRYQISDSEITQPGQSVSLKIYDVSGRVVKDLGTLSVAEHASSVKWNGTDQSDRKLPCGVYFVTLKSAEYSDSRMVLLVK